MVAHCRCNTDVRVLGRPFRFNATQRAEGRGCFRVASRIDLIAELGLLTLHLNGCRACLQLTYLGILLPGFDGHRHAILPGRQRTGGEVGKGAGWAVRFVEVQNRDSIRPGLIGIKIAAGGVCGLTRHEIGENQEKAFSRVVGFQ